MPIIEKEIPRKLEFSTVLEFISGFSFLCPYFSSDNS